MGKWDLSDEDKSDFEQEQRIKEWVTEQSNGEFDFQYINRKGNARNSGFKGISLDQKIGENGSSTFADIIAGYDGRDMEGRDDIDRDEIDPKEQIELYLFYLGFAKGEFKCLVKVLKKLILENKSLFPKSQTDSEW